MDRKYKNLSEDGKEKKNLFVRMFEKVRDTIDKNETIFLTVLATIQCTLFVVAVIVMIVGAIML